MQQQNIKVIFGGRRTGRTAAARKWLEETNRIEPKAIRDLAARAGSSTGSTEFRKPLDSNDEDSV